MLLSNAVVMLCFTSLMEQTSMAYGALKSVICVENYLKRLATDARTSAHARSERTSRSLKRDSHLPIALNPVSLL